MRIAPTPALNGVARVRLAGIAGLGCLLIGTAYASPWRVGIVMGRSMEPTLRPGSLFFYNTEHPHLQRGELIVFKRGSQFWIKRVYAVGGESIWTLRENAPEHRYVDLIRPDQLPLFARLVRKSRKRGREMSLVRIRIPRDHVYLVADGATGIDSRHIGPVPVGEVAGRVTVVPGAESLEMPGWIERSFPPRPTPGARASREDWSQGATKPWTS